MDLFRRRQKLIFWSAGIISLPACALGRGGSGTFGDNPQRDFEVGQIDGKKFSYAEFEAFRKRIQAAVGGMPLQFAGAPGTGTPSEELWKYTFAYALLKDAEKAGSHASDLQVGTYLDNSHPALAGSRDSGDPQAMERAVDTFCRQMQMSRTEFLRGVREWQTMGNYLVADANLAAVNDDTVYTMYALTRAEVDVKRVRVLPTPEILETARRDVMEKPADDLEADVRTYLLEHSDQRRYREEPQWRFAYVHMPMAAESMTRPATDEEVKAQYESNKGVLYEDLPLEQVEERVRADLARRELERQTLRNFTVDVDPQLRSHADMPLDELSKLAQLAKYGVRAGDTGDTALPTAELVAKLPEGAGNELEPLLTEIDAARLDARDAMIEEWKDSYSLAMRPVRTEDGYIRLRLLEYIPSRPAELEDADGAVKKDLFDQAVEDMVTARAAELVRERALEVEASLREMLAARQDGRDVDAETASDFDSLATETIAYTAIPDGSYELGRMTVGEILGPLPFSDLAAGANGQELLVLVDRRVPSREAFDNETPEAKAGVRQMALSNFRGNFGFTYTFTGPAAIIQPSPAIMAGIAERFNRGQIRLNPELLGQTGG